MRKVFDERLFKVNHEILSKSYYFFLLMICLGAALKYMIGIRGGNGYYLEAAALAGSLGYVLFHGAGKSFFVKKLRDERVRQEEEKSLARAFWWCFWIYALGNLYYLMIAWNLPVLTVNLAVFLIVDMAVAILQFRRGLLGLDYMSGRKDNHGGDRFKRLKIAAFAGGILFGGVMLWLYVGHALPFSMDKALVCTGVFVLSGLFYGYFWYFCMKMLMVGAQRRSDRELEEKEDGE